VLSLSGGLRTLRLELPGLTLDTSPARQPALPV
jgi:hypothetical protein